MKTSAEWFYRIDNYLEVGEADEKEFRACIADLEEKERECEELRKDRSLLIGRLSKSEGQLATMTERVGKARQVMESLPFCAKCGQFHRQDSTVADCPTYPINIATSPRTTASDLALAQMRAALKIVAHRSQLALDNPDYYLPEEAADAVRDALAATPADGLVEEVRWLLENAEDIDSQWFKRRDRLLSRLGGCK